MADILLLGGSGLLGSALHEALLKNNDMVVAPRHRDVDMQDHAALEKCVLAAMPRAIINAAALINVNEIEKDPLPAWRVNALAAGAIAKILRDHGLVTPYYFIGTSYVFGSSGHAHAEDDTLSPVNMYGKTKAHGETLIRKYCEEGHIPHYILRASWLYSRKRPTFVDEVAKTILAGENFVAWADQIGNPTSAADFAETFILEFIRKAERESGNYHIINSVPTESGGVSRYEIACEVASILGKPHEMIKRSVSDPSTMAKRPAAYLKNTKLPPLRDWREALREHIVAARA